MSISNITSPNACKLCGDMLHLHTGIQCNQINAQILNSNQINANNQTMTGTVAGNIINSNTTMNCTTMNAPNINSVTIGNTITYANPANSDTLGATLGYVTFPDCDSISTNQIRTDYLALNINQTLNGVAVGGACIGNVPFIKFALISSNLATINISPYTNDQGSAYDYIFTGAGTVPAQFRPAQMVIQPVNLISNNTNYAGHLLIHPDGLIEWKGFFLESPAVNGWTEIYTMYTLV